MTLKQMLDDKDLKITQLESRLRGTIETAKITLRNEIKEAQQEIWDSNEKVLLEMTGSKVSDNWRLLVSNASTEFNGELIGEIRRFQHSVEISFVSAYSRDSNPEFGSVMRAEYSNSSFMRLWVPKWLVDKLK